MEHSASPDDEELELALLRLADDTLEIQHVLMQFPVLLSDRCDAVMDEIIKRAESTQETQLVAVYQSRRLVLRQIRESLSLSGIPSAFHGDVFAADTRARRAAASNDLKDLTTAANSWIELLARADLKDMPPAFIGQVLGSTAQSLLARFRISQDLSDIDHAISLWETHTTVKGIDPETIPTAFNNVGRAYLDRYAKSNEAGDLDGAASAFGEALHRSGLDHELRPLMLQGLGESLLFRNLYIGRIDEVRVALKAYDEASPQFEGGWAAFLPQIERVATIFFDRAKQEDSAQMLDCAIEVSVRLVEHSRVTEAPYPERLAGLARAFYERAARLGDVSDLDSSISHWARVHELAVDRNPAVTWLDGYALALRLRFTWQGSAQDLTDAIALWERAVETVEEADTALPAVLGNLSGALRERYATLGNDADLLTGAQYAERALSLVQDDAETTVSLLGQHAAILQDRYTRFGEPGDLEVAITDLVRARAIAGESQPLFAEVLHSLGLAYRLRYLRAGTLGDLESALSVFVDAIQSTPANATQRLARYQGDLALALVERFRHAHQASDLDQAIELFDSALAQLPAHAPQRAAILSNQGMAYGNRHKHVSHQVEDLQRAAEAFQQAVEAAPESSVERLAFLNNLAVQTHELYLMTGDVEQLGRALAAVQEAVDQAPVTLPARPIYLATLGVILREKFGKEQRLKDRDATVAAYREGASSGLQLNLELAMGNARNWLNWAFERSAWDEVTEAYGLLRRAVEQLIQGQVLRRTKEVWLSEIQGLTARAAYAFAILGKGEEAVETLEEGQARLVSEKLAFSRVSLESLQGTSHQDLLDRFRETVEDWEAAQRSDPDKLPGLHSQLSELTAAIRAIPGHEDFLRPSGMHEVARATTDQRILVYLAATSAGGVALLVESVSVRVTVRVITLPQLTTEAIDSRVRGTQASPGYLTAYHNWLATPQDAEARQAWLDALDALGGWLGRTVLGAIAEILPTGAQVTFIPAGALALLPLHVAWTQTESDGLRRYLTDHTAISYAPNARTLVVAADRWDETGGSGLPETLVAVHSTHNPEAEDLQGAPLEVDAVLTHFSRSRVFEGKQATRENVLEALNTCAVAHFACHGRADLKVPLASGLLMADGQWLTVADLMKAHPPELKFAVLSACETAMPGTQLPDEAVGLPGGLLAVGACGVVASLWSVSDASTMLLMTRFYDNWFAQELAPAEALFRAQAWLRDSTNEALLVYLREAVEGGFATERAYQLLRMALGFQPKQRKAFAHPFYWGAFCYVGT